MVISTLKEKLCLKNKKKFNPSFDYLINCNKKKNRGTKGGISSVSLNFIKENGIVNEECIKDYNEKCPKEEEIKECEKIKIKEQCVVNRKEMIKKEIFLNGPVIGSVPFFKDFLLYKSGTFYTDVESTKIEGKQMVKIVGWDKNKDGNEFWIVENCFGEDYGMNGYINIYLDNEENFFSEVLSFRL